MVQRIEEIVGGALLALLVGLWLIVGYWPKPKDISVPTQLEKTCFVEGTEAGTGNWLPCFIADEGRRPEWQI
jgi:hypothetical protein